MDNEIENADSPNGESETGGNTDLTALQEKYQKLEDSNKQLYERTKKAEGEAKELRVKNEDKPSKKSDEFGLLEKTFLRSSGYTDSDEIELFKKWREDTGKSVDELVEHPFVKAEIEKMRTTKTNALATDNVKGEGGTNESKNDPDYWLSKATTGADGKLMFPEDLPKDYKLRAAIVDKMIASTKSGKEFYNS